MRKILKHEVSGYSRLQFSRKILQIRRRLVLKLSRDIIICLLDAILRRRYIADIPRVFVNA